MTTAKTKPNKNENVLGANYIIEFYNEVKALTDNYSAYLNIHLATTTKYGNTSEAKPDEQENAVIKQTIDNLRFYANKAQIHFLTIAEITGIDKEEVEKQYAELNTQFMPNKDNLTAYVLSLNKILAGKIIQNLLENSQTLIDALYPNQ